MINRIFLCAIFVITDCAILKSQSTSSSPYSRYGLGEINAIGTAQNFSLGGNGIAIQNSTYGPFFINPTNPASYVHSPLTVFEAGILNNTTKLLNENASALTNNASVNYLAFMVPVNKWWGSCVGLKPYSNVGYKINDSEELSGAGLIDYVYEGTGGVSQFYWGNAFAPFSNRANAFKKSQKYKRLLEEKNIAKINQVNKRIKAISGLSFGANASYLFGGFENTRRVIFPDTSGSYNFRTTRITRFNSLILNYGIQHSITIDSVRQKKTYYTPDSVRKDTVIKVERADKIKIAAGFTAQLNSSIRATDDLVSITYERNPGYVNEEEIKDTIENYEGKRGNITLPLQLGYGISIRKGEKWLISAEYAVQNWSQYSFFGESTLLKNSMSASLGFQYVPDYKAEAKSGKSFYYKKINYRAGLRYMQSPLELKNTRINETAISLGVGLPVGRSSRSTQFSVLNIGVELGQRGTVDNGLIKEQFARVIIGFTLNDKWFIPAKFD